MKLIFCAFTLFSFAQSLYSSNSKVVALTPQNFNSLVLNSDDIWLVEFYAPWCGHCKQLAPEFEKAAKALSPMIKLGAVDMDQYKDMGSSYNIQGFPTLKFFGADKKKPIDYNQQRTASSIVDFCLSQAKSIVQQKLTSRTASDEKKSQPKKPQNKTPGKAREGSNTLEDLTESDFKTEVLNSDDQWFILFYAPWCGHCKAMMPAFQEAARDVPKIIRFGRVDCTAHQSVCGDYQVQGYPTLKFFSSGRVEDYNGGRGKQDFVEFSERKAESHTPRKELAEMANNQIFEDYCINHNGLCFVAFLPDVRDSGEEKRKEYLGDLKHISENSIAHPFNFLWVQGGNNFDFEEKFQLGFGFPALIAINSKHKKYSIMRSNYSKDSINKFIDDLLMGKAKVNEMPAQVPKIKERKQKAKVTTEEL